jgi:hypothetical protein
MAEEPKSSGNNEQEKKQKPLWLLFIFCLVGLLALIGVGGFFMNRCTPEKAYTIKDTLAALKEIKAKYDAGLKISEDAYSYHYSYSEYQINKYVKDFSYTKSPFAMDIATDTEGTKVSTKYRSKGGSYYKETGTEQYTVTESEVKAEIEKGFGQYDLAIADLGYEITLLEEAIKNDSVEKAIDGKQANGTVHFVIKGEMDNGNTKYLRLKYVDYCLVTFIKQVNTSLYSYSFAAKLA